MKHEHCSVAAREEAILCRGSQPFCDCSSSGAARVTTGVLRRLEIKDESDTSVETVAKTFVWFSVCKGGFLICLVVFSRVPSPSTTTSLMLKFALCESERKGRSWGT